MNAMKIIGAVIMLLLLVAWDGSYAYGQPGGAGTLAPSIVPVQKYRAPQIQVADVSAVAQYLLPAVPIFPPGLDVRSAWLIGRLGPLPEYQMSAPLESELVRSGGVWKYVTPLPLPRFDSRGELWLERLAPLPEYQMSAPVESEMVRSGGVWKYVTPLPASW